MILIIPTVESLFVVMTIVLVLEANFLSYLLLLKTSYLGNTLKYSFFKRPVPFFFTFFFFFFGLTTLFQICVLLRVDESAFNQTITLEVDMYEDDFGTPSQVPFRSKTVDVFLDDILASVVVDVSENDFGSLLFSRNDLSTILSGLHKDCVLICKLLRM